jgi:hypothetical protein
VYNLISNTKENDVKVQNLRSADVIECRIAGIPAQIAVWGSGKYTVMDRRGYEAGWLAKKVDSSFIHEIIQIDAEERLDRHRTGE